MSSETLSKWDWQDKTLLFTRRSVLPGVREAKMRMFCWNHVFFMTKHIFSYCYKPPEAKFYSLSNSFQNFQWIPQFYQVKNYFNKVSQPTTLFFVFEKKWISLEKF
jgi:hypothetical protein